MIKAKDLTFEYIRRDDTGNVSEVVEALQGITMSVKPGMFVGILGNNGSGKTTFAKLLNVLLEPTEGTLYVGGMDTADDDFLWNIRQMSGMVFQNPDNQLIGTLVDEDVAFGPENLGLSETEISIRVSEALKETGLSHKATVPIKDLSGGEKQRVAIAGILAMKPGCLILDEATSMLDPAARRQVLDTVIRLNQEEHLTVIYITHYAEELVEADWIYCLKDGKILTEGTPREVFAKERLLEESGISVPAVCEFAQDLYEAGVPLELPVLDGEGLVSALHRVMAYQKLSEMNPVLREERTPAEDIQAYKDSVGETEATLAATKGLIFSHVSFRYDKKADRDVLSDVSFAVSPGERVALVGACGAGKSTLLQLMQGLYTPGSGEIYYKGKLLEEWKTTAAEKRPVIGLTLQYPENQFFAKTVLQEVSYGPKNLGLPLLEVQARAFGAIASVGLADTVYDLAPWELSGGQKRLVAIASVLAMNPDLLLLDEPTAGLDRKHGADLMGRLDDLCARGYTVVFATHDMDAVSEHADRVLVLQDGILVADETPSNFFQKREKLKEWQLGQPEASKWLYELKRAGYEVRTDGCRRKDVFAEIRRLLLM